MIADPAIVVLDALKGNSYEVPEREASIAAIGAFLERYRESGRTPIFVRHLHHPYTMSEGYLHNNPHDDLADIYNVGKDSSRINPDLEVRDTDPIITKHRYGAFYQTDLELHLSSNDIEEVIFTGYGTLGAVAHTLHGAYNRGYRVTVFSDCVSTRIPPRHDEFLEKVERTYGRVMESTDFELGPIEDPPFGYTDGSVVSTVPWQGGADTRNA